ncbi:MAG: DsbA family oxidoreductase [Caulobacterales bacterium]|nr:DsbA family oxidoreductase [Caulobacterales bacterium]
MSESVRLDIVSDVVCPWCWLGKKRLEAALAAEPDITVDVRWRPFQLDPTLPAEGMPYRDYMRAKFAGLAGDDRFAPMRAHLEAAGADYGIAFRFGDIAIRPNSFNAHRVMTWAQEAGLADPMAEALFAAFFRDLRDIGDVETLADIAGEVGLDRADIAARLASDRDVEAVRREETRFRELGVSSVPTFIADGRRAVVGAHEPETLRELLKPPMLEAVL